MKKLLALLLAVIMVFTLFACTGKQEETKGNETNGGNTTDPTDDNGNTNDPTGDDETNPGEDPVETGYQLKEVDYQDASYYTVTEEVTVTFWHNISNSAREEWVEQKAQEFMKLYPNITVVVHYAGAYGAIRKAITACMAADGEGLPTCSTINVPYMQVYADNEILTSLNEYFYGTDNVDQASDYLDGVMDAVTYTGDGEVYGIPFAITSSINYYNATKTAELGLEIPETWAEFKTWCETIYNATGCPAFGFSDDQNNVANWFINLATELVGDDEYADVDDESVVALVTELKEMADKGWIKMYDDTDELRTAFLAQMIFGECDTSASFVKIVDGFVEGQETFEVASNIGIVKEEGETPYTTVSGSCIMIFDYEGVISQQEKNAAFLWMLYLTSTENNADWAVQTLSYATRLSALESETIQPLYDQYPAFEAILKALPDSLITKNRVSCYNDAVTEFCTELLAVFQGEKDVATAISDAKKAMDALLADAYL